MRDEKSAKDQKAKFPKATEVLSRQPSRDNYAPDKGGGDPHMNHDDKPLASRKSGRVTSLTRRRRSKGMTCIVVPLVRYL